MGRSHSRRACTELVALSLKPEGFTLGSSQGGCGGAQAGAGGTGDREL